MADEQKTAGTGAQAAQEKWFTTAEAAEYLGVSQATIFRWMKQGLLSFHKIGKATRFSQEGLDAVVMKTTGQTEAEAAAGKCSSCGHSILVDGTLQGIGRTYFRPDKTKFWTFLEAMVPLKVAACAACGHIDMRADTSKLTRLMPESSEA
jgi:excisionase family DNA binding protein